VDEAGNDDLKVIKDTLNRQEVLGVRRMPQNRGAVDIEKGVTGGVINGRVVKQQDTRRSLGNAWGEPPHLLDDTAEVEPPVVAGQGDLSRGRVKTENAAVR